MDKYTLQGLRRSQMEKRATVVPGMVESQWATHTRRLEDVAGQKREELREKIAEFELQFCRWCDCW